MKILLSPSNIKIPLIRTSKKENCFGSWETNQVLGDERPVDQGFDYKILFVGHPISGQHVVWKLCEQRDCPASSKKCARVHAHRRRLKKSKEFKSQLGMFRDQRLLVTWTALVCFCLNMIS